MSKDAYVKLLDILPGMIWASGPDGAANYFNSRWLEFTGHELEEQVGEGWMEGIHPEDREHRVATYLEAFAKREPFHAEYRLRYHAGSYRWVADQGTPFIDESGDFNGFLGCCLPMDEGAGRDGDTRRNSHFDSLNVLAGSIAHDLNNQLTPILLNLSMSQNLLENETGPYTKDIQHRLRESEEAAHHAQTLANRLLTFGKGGIPVKQHVDIGKLLEETVSFAISSTGDKVTSEISVADDLRFADADPDQIGEVLQNLLANSIEAMPDGGRVKLNACNMTDPDHPSLEGRLTGPFLRIRVEDEGEGLSFLESDRIFEPFFSTKTDHSGLGLSAAQAIVHNHGGEIVSVSETGECAIFDIFLPAAALKSEKEGEPTAFEVSTEEHMDSEETVEFGAKDKPEPIDMTNPGRVLVMDDEPLVRSSLEGMLKAYGFEVETATNGEEALEAYSRAKESDHPIDCTLMDLTIHCGMGGKEAIGRLIALDPDAKAVVCTGYTNDMIMNNFSTYGFKGAIRKPFQPDELNRVLNDTIHAN